MKAVIAVEIDDKNFDVCKKAIDILSIEADSFDMIAGNFRSVSGEPLFEEKALEILKRDTK